MSMRFLGALSVGLFTFALPAAATIGEPCTVVSGNDNSIVVCRDRQGRDAAGEVCAGATFEFNGGSDGSGGNGLINTSAGECVSATPPAEWTCPVGFYFVGRSNDCDCGCGAFDPDCIVPFNPPDDQPPVAIESPHSASVCDFQLTCAGVINLENNALCEAAPPPEGVCGDHPDFDECADGNRDDGDGCSSRCKLEAPPDVLNDTWEAPAGSDFACDQTQHSTSITDPYTGEFRGPDACDCGCGSVDGNCVDHFNESGEFVAGASAASCDANRNHCAEGTVPDANDNSHCVAVNTATGGCGDHFTDWFGGSERCDDGGDGTRCTADCTAFLDPTQDPCGNGETESFFAEQCDDGNRDNDDGCSDVCTIERLAGEAPRCGDGIIDSDASGTTAGEECDDGNNDDGDGCAAFCSKEAGWECRGDEHSECLFVGVDDGTGTSVCDGLNAGNGCDCGCFQHDPDCSDESSRSCDASACPEGTVVSADNNAFCAAAQAEDGTDLTGYHCNPATFGDGDCDCGCGLTDVDCASTEAAVCEVAHCGVGGAVPDASDNSVCVLDFSEECGFLDDGECDEPDLCAPGTDVNDCQGEEGEGEEGEGEEGEGEEGEGEEGEGEEGEGEDGGNGNGNGSNNDVNTGDINLQCSSDRSTSHGVPVSSAALLGLLTLVMARRRQS